MQIHPFVDGDKRTAFAVVDVFLRIDAHRITAHSKSIHKAMVTFMEQGQFDMAHLVPWLESVIAPAVAGKPSVTRSDF